MRDYACYDIVFGKERMRSDLPAVGGRLLWLPTSRAVPTATNFIEGRESIENEMRKFRPDDA